MRILFAVPSPHWLRHFDGVVSTLVERGHDIIVGAGADATRESVASHVGHLPVSVARVPLRRVDEWNAHAPVVRAFRACLHAFGDGYRGASRYQARATDRFCDMLSRIARRRGTSTAAEADAVVAPADVLTFVDMFPSRSRSSMLELLRLVENVIPTDPGHDTFIASLRPDVVLFTPLLAFGAAQTDLAKSAIASNIPTGLLVYSWDNLTTKGLMHVIPDRVFVWNETQAEEASTLHGVPPHRVTITGAPRFDGFFLLAPHETREGFCERLGLEPSRPIVLYVCSSQFVIESEQPFVERWLREIRSHETLAPANVVVRLHPDESNRDAWGAWAQNFQRVAVTPSSERPVDQTLYDALFHASAVVGLNTSAALEAAIIGRPVLTIDAPQEAAGQRESLHFWYLLEERGGFVRYAADFPMHSTQLAAAIQQGGDPTVSRSFTERFLRPHGMERPVVPILADAIEEWALSTGSSAASSVAVAGHRGQHGVSRLSV